MRALRYRDWGAENRHCENDAYHDQRKYLYDPRNALIRICEKAKKRNTENRDSRPAIHRAGQA